MKLLKYLLLLIFSTNLFASLPDWINQIGPCSSDEICTIGTGSNLKDAISDSRAEIAKFFETKVKVNSKVINSTQTVNSGPSNMQFSEWTSKVIDLESDELLSGILTKKSEEINGVFYVLASLPKSFAAGKLRESILKLDNENNSLVSRNSRFVFPQIFVNLKKRDYYQARYSLVSNDEISPKMTYEKLNELISNLPSIKISIVQTSEKLPQNISTMLEKIFSSFKVVFVNKNEKPEYFLKVEVKYVDEYFKVEGFKKISVYLKLLLKNSQNKTLGRVSSGTTQISRTKEMALNMAIETIENDIKENLDQLTIGLK